MAATIADLDFIAPAIADADEDVKQQALDMAAGFRPACLSDALQDQAQLWYAAWMLYSRAQQTAQGVVAGAVTSEREGDLQRTYGAARADGISDPAGFYARWKCLSDLCGRGAILASGRPNGHRAF